MTRRIRREDLDKLLELVQSNPLPESADRGDSPFVDNSNSVWSLNHEFWVELLRSETNDSWSDAEYVTAAHIVNLAEHQRVVFGTFAKVLDETLPHNGDDGHDAGDGDEFGNFVMEWGDQILLSDLLEGAREMRAEAAHDDADGLNGDAHHDKEDNAPLSPLSFRNADIAASITARTRESQTPSLNQVRSDLFIQTGIASLSPYVDWYDFQHRNKLPESLIADLKASYPDGVHTLDVVMGSLAEASSGGPLGPTLLAAAREEATRLARLYPVDGEQLLSGTELLSGQAAKSFEELLARHSGSIATDADPALFNVEQTHHDLNTINGTDADDTLIGTDGDDLMIGGAGDDVFIPGAGKDVVHGGGGIERIVATVNDDDDFYDGGEDSDTYDMSQTEAPATVNLRIGTATSAETGHDIVVNIENVVGSQGDDSITGSHVANVLEGGKGDDTVDGDDGNDAVYGGEGHDTAYGGAGDDTVDGGSGADVMYGGLGNDTIFIDDAGDVYVEYFGEGTDTATTTLDTYALENNVEVLIYIGDGGFTGDGNALDNLVVGGQLADILSGYDGDDTLEGNAGDDTLIGGVGHDVLYGGAGNDLLCGDDAPDADTSGVDLYVAGQDATLVIATADSSGYGSSSYLAPESINTLIYVGDTQLPDLGSDLAILIQGETIKGGKYDDILLGGDGDDTLKGNGGDDELYGDSGNDYIDGGSGDDYLDGGDGDDIVIGGSGKDYVLFTSGNDTLVLRPGFGNDVVVGFDTESSGSGSHDRIDVTAYHLTSADFGFDIMLIYDGDSTLVRIGSDSIKLVLVDLDTMDRNDFIFS